MISKNSKYIYVNFIGKLWNVIAGVIFIPIYISYLGVESYSLISFTLLIGSIMSIMDSGLSANLTREFAISNNTLLDKRKIFRTLESVFFIISFLAIIFILLISKFIVTNWLKISSINNESVITCIRILSFEIGLRLLSNFYISGLNGLDIQVLSNLFQIIYSTLRNGIVLIPLFYFRSLELFFLWQFFSSLIYVIVLRFTIFNYLTYDLPSFFSSPRIEMPIILRIWKFAGGMMLISIVAAINTQLDKITLSFLLPIETLGLYTLCFSLANGLLYITTPISNALLPQMIYSRNNNSKNELVFLFLNAQKIISVILFSSYSLLAIFSKEIIWLWTNDYKISNMSYNYLPWLALGSTFLGLQILPFNIAIANGYTKLNNYLGSISLIVTIPCYWFLINIFGGLGASWTYAFVQVLIGLFYIFYINSKYLFIAKKIIYGKLIFVPISLSLFISFMFKKIFTMSNERLFLGIEILVIFLIIIYVNYLIIFTKKR